MKYLVIYDAHKKNSLSIGDVVRFLELIKFSRFLIATNKENGIFFKNFNHQAIIDINKLKIKNLNYNIINLIIGKKYKNNIFDINDHLTNKDTNKILTYKIIEKFKKKIKLNSQKIKKNIILSKKIVIGINWIVPKNWKIKSYPMIYWKLLEKNIFEKYSLKVTWQKKNNLNNYIKWIKSCDLIISIVGLGVHIASYFDKNIIMLSGPTDFYESSRNKNILKITPKKYCRIHSHKLNANYKKCNCMSNIDPKTILNEIDLMTKKN